MTNEFLVGVSADGRSVHIFAWRDPYGMPKQITREQALNLAALIVALCDPLGDDFARALKEALE